MDANRISFLINEVKQKPQICNLEDSFVEKLLNNYFLRRGDMRKTIEKLPQLSSKNKYVKEVVKQIRKEIGEVYGSYQTSQHKRKTRFLKENNYEELLKCHKSTRERLSFYPFIYKNILNWYTPTKGIADIACGFNPISFVELEKILGNSLFYYACDLSSEDMNFLNEFFYSYELNGKAVAQDVTKKSFLEDKNFQECDLVLLLKALDSFETDKKNSSKDLLLELPQKKIVISFPTKSLVAQKEVSSSKRTWLFKFLDEQQWDYYSFEIENEMFILVTKN